MEARDLLAMRNSKNGSEGNTEDSLTLMRCLKSLASTAVKDHLAKLMLRVLISKSLLRLSSWRRLMALKNKSATRGTLNALIVKGQDVSQARSQLSVVHAEAEVTTQLSRDRFKFKKFVLVATEQVNESEVHVCRVKGPVRSMDLQNSQ